MGPQRRGQTGQVPEVRVQFRVRWQAQAQVLGSLGSSTPHDLGWVLQIGPWHTPSGLPPPAPGAGAAGGAHLSPTRPAGEAGPAPGR